MEEVIIYEQECNMPENWGTNLILERDEKGNIIEHTKEG